jgi:hypothetical protein
MHKHHCDSGCVYSSASHRWEYAQDDTLNCNKPLHLVLGQGAVLNKYSYCCAIPTIQLPSTDQHPFNIKMCLDANSHNQDQLCHGTDSMQLAVCKLIIAVNFPRAKLL